MEGASWIFMEFLRRASPLQWEVLRRLPRQNQRGTSCWWGHHQRSNGDFIFMSITTLLRLMITIVWHHYIISFSRRYTSTIIYNNNIRWHTKCLFPKPTPTAWEASATGSAGSCWPSWTCRDKHILGGAEAADHDNDHQQHQIHPWGAPMASPPEDSILHPWELDVFPWQLQ